LEYLAWFAGRKLSILSVPQFSAVEQLCDFCGLSRQITALPPEFVPIRDLVSRQRTACLGIHLVAGLESQIRGDRPPVPNRISTKIRSFSISAGWCLVVVNQGVKWQKRLFLGPGVQPFSVF
jgi:hypothetical protein